METENQILNRIDETLNYINEGLENINITLKKIVDEMYLSRMEKKE